jgi:ABC-2 type transport system ATP-binding protein
MNEPVIEMNAVEKSFGRHRVLHPTTLRIEAGTTFALIGRNGAGKTTLLRILLGLLTPDAGSVRLAGVDPAVDPITARSRTGYLAEDQTMYGWMTPTELCRFLAPFYPTWDMQLADAFLRRLHIPPGTRIRHLSKGQAVRLGFLVAMAHRPPVMVLDDPTMGLDPIARKEFNRDLVDDLQGWGGTVLYSSHLLGEVEAVADQVAILDQGRLLRTGSTEELREAVKLVLVTRSEITGWPRPEGLLDVRAQGDRLAMVIDHAPEFLRLLREQSVACDVESLTLDEIFEAFVIGRSDDWPGESRASGARQNTLQTP